MVFGGRREDFLQRVYMVEYRHKFIELQCLKRNLLLFLLNYAEIIETSINRLTYNNKIINYGFDQICRGWSLFSLTIFGPVPYSHVIMSPLPHHHAVFLCSSISLTTYRIYSHALLVFYQDISYSWISMLCVCNYINHI